MGEHFWVALVSSVVFWALATLFLGASYVFLDRVLLKDVHFSEELKKNNIAVAIVIASFLIGMSLVIFGVTN